MVTGSSTQSAVKISELKPETIATFKVMYAEKRELLEYLKKFGNAFEKAAANLILEVGSEA